MRIPGVNRLRYYRYCLEIVGPSYPIFLLKKAVSSRQSGEMLANFSGKGLEIGGPSEFFRLPDVFPIYSVAGTLDNVNYSAKTFWEGSLEAGKNFSYDPQKEPGYQFICEAVDLSPLPSSSYDFVASCHTLEHCANPLKALGEWKRVLKNDGWLVLALPHKSGTFDRRRAVTSLEHILEDYRRNVTEDDATHFADILENHDFSRSPAHKTAEELRDWITANSVNRGAHHHVFDAELAVNLADYAGFEVLSADVLLPFHILLVARKSTKSCEEKQKAKVKVLKRCCAGSPFELDRRHG